MKSISAAPIVAFALLLSVSCGSSTPDDPAGVGGTSQDLGSLFGEPREHDRGEVPNDWFVQQRAFPRRDLDQRARLNAFEDAARSPLATAASTWTFAGPDNVGGRITDIEAHPSVPGLVYVATAAGGVFRSLDGGTSFTPIFDAQPSLSIGDIALDPRDPNVVWVGTGESNSAGDTYPGSGVYVSRDRGATWTSMGLVDTQQIGRVVVDPTSSDTIWVAALGNMRTADANRGVYRSTNGGRSWENVLFRASDAGAIDLAVDPSSPSTVYAAFWEHVRTPDTRVAGGVNSGLFKSSNGGGTWSQLTTGLPASVATTGRIGLSVCASSPRTLYAIFDDTKANFNGVYRSDNGGMSWARTKDRALKNLYSTYGWWFGNVRCSPTDPNTAFALGFGIAKTSNGGGTWTGATGQMHPDQHAMFIDPHDAQHLFVGNDGGFHVSKNGGRSYVGPSRLPATQFYDLAIDPRHPNRLYGGAQDNGVVRTTSGGTSDWAAIYGGDGMMTVLDPVDPNVIYSEAQNGAIGKSTDGGKTFSDLSPTFDRANWNTPIHLDPTDHNVLFFGGNKLLRSADAGSSFQAISPDLTSGVSPGLPGFGTITTFDVSRVDHKTIYVGTDDANVWVTRDAGVHWQTIASGLPKRYVTRVVADSVNPSHVFVTLSGYGTDGHLFASDDAGATWRRLDAALPQVPVNVVVQDPSSVSTLFVGTDVGVFTSADAGQTWQAMRTGMPVVPVLDLALDAGSRRLVAATHGRSMYATHL